jgi:hypothetical protein
VLLLLMLPDPGAAAAVATCCRCLRQTSCCMLAGLGLANAAGSGLQKVRKKERGCQPRGTGEARGSTLLLLPVLLLCCTHLLVLGSPGCVHC